MNIKLYLNKSLEENAEVYFKKAKEAKKKLEGAKIALEFTNKKIEQVKSEEIKQKKIQEIKQKRPPRKQQWYEKFRWFLTSKDELVIGGRDATTNEIVIKKHTEKNDLVFHTDMAGSPFVVLKGNDKQSIKEAAQFTGCLSKAWKLGQGVADVFYVTPDQVTKEAPSGEFIQKGSFMIYGKKQYVQPELHLWIGIMEDGTIMVGPKEAVQKHCTDTVQVVQGNQKISDVAKKIKKKFHADNLDEIIRALPQGSALPKGT